MDDVTEKLIAVRWLEFGTGEYMLQDVLARLVRNGLYECDRDEQCLSRSICGEDACRCIRSVFPHPDFYCLYAVLRENYMSYDIRKILKMEKIENERTAKGDNPKG